MQARSATPRDRIDAIAAIATELGAEDVVAEAASLADRLTEQRFYVACVGQFKRGKSTLINALVGTNALPVGVVPITSVVTVVRYGEPPSARVRRGGAWMTVPLSDLAAYVSEEQNPENVKRVEGVEVLLASPLLASGMCLVDTPGVGSIFAGNTAATKDFVPHIDAALVVLGADPPISGDELTLVKDIAREARRMLVVINKADRLPDAELAEGRRFVEAVLAKELQRPTERLYEVSAAERLASSAATRDWIALERELARLASESGASLLREAERRGTRRLCAALVHQLRERRRALEEPVGTSLARLEALRRAAAEAEMALRGVGHAFSAEQEDLSRRFEERRLAFVVEATPRGRQRLVAALDAANEHGPKLRAMGFTMTQQIAEALVLEWLVVVEPIAEEMYRGAMQRLVDGANKLTTRLALGEGASSILELPAETGFHAKRRFHFLAYMTLTSKGPVVWLLDRLRGRDSLQRAVARDMRAFLDRLLEVNSARVANDLRERVLESRRALEAAVRTRLRSLVTISERSIAVAAKAQAQGEEGVHRELALITAMEERVSSVVGG